MSLTFIILLFSQTDAREDDSWVAVINCSFSPKKMSNPKTHNLSIQIRFIPSLVSLVKLHGCPLPSV